ncbi:MAG: hypothetical protein N2444_04700, partial [Methylocystis sp.]|nr:hypothetical protein [Methylocystis sp.]
MRSRSDARGWEFGPSAATLVLAYLLVLQGVFAGAMSLRAANAFGAAICLSKASGPLNDNPVAPRAPMRHGEKCCVFHSAAGGSPPALHPFAGEPPRALNFVA